MSEHTFDGIRDDKIGKMPLSMTLLFVGLILWALAFMGYYLLSGWSSEAEFQAKMQTHAQQHEQSPPSEAR